MTAFKFNPEPVPDHTQTPSHLFSPSGLDIDAVVSRLRTRESTDTFLVHCSASRPSQLWDVVDVDRIHRQRGFTCVGYHFILPRQGGIQTGRPSDTMGAHCRDQQMNHRSIGICLIGGVAEDPVSHRPGWEWNGSDAEANFTPAQMDSLRRLLDHLSDTYGDQPVKGHRDIQGVRKACPSFDVGRWMDTGQHPTTVD